MVVPAGMSYEFYVDNILAKTTEKENKWII